ncbi:hypothetical protein PoB_005106500 [Plakobranchus ocellatus]|uniref:Uncharacterized protein n=1 Tax=Plakobranchus ocellatus TaxID=259542 RepID=A0AAV4BZ17_9GAST|nr:hypothetical protein PoB_005106500 [Plakobranchus ocellatus]
MNCELCRGTIAPSLAQSAYQKKLHIIMWLHKKTPIKPPLLLEVSTSNLFSMLRGGGRALGVKGFTNCCSNETESCSAKCSGNETPRGSKGHESLPRLDTTSSLCDIVIPNF